MFIMAHNGGWFLIFIPSLNHKFSVNHGMFSLERFTGSTSVVEIDTAEEDLMQTV